VINELIEELEPQPRMLPVDPIARAEARAWMIFAGDQLMPQGFKAQMAMAQGPAKAIEASFEPLRAAFGRVEAQLGRRTGRFFFGDAFGLVDAAYAPFFRRWRASEDWGDAKLLPQFPRLSAYADALLAHPSVIKAQIPELGPKLRHLLLERAASEARA
jgi:glutathione S-transferase